MITNCIVCGKKYQLREVEDPENFQCTCGGNLEEPENTRDKKKNYKEKTNEILKLSATFKIRKALLERGYTISDEDENRYVSKEVPVVPTWLLMIIAILFPLGTIIAILAYFFWRKTRVVVLEKD